MEIQEIKWRNGEKYIFGEVNGLTLFYIKDREIGGGLDKYELVVKFLDRRWSSNSIDELKITAGEQLELLAHKLVKS